MLDPRIEPSVAEARAMAAKLQKAAHRGVGDRDKSVRERVARETGVPASYLLRLHRRAQEMTDVSGKYARLLRIACAALEERTERANRLREEATHALLEMRRPMAEGRGEACGDDGAASARTMPASGGADRASASV